MQMLNKLNLQYEIIQRSGLKVSMNDLDCCMIVIHERKIKNNPTETKKILNLPFTDINVNLFNYTITNKKDEIRFLEKTKI